MTFDDLSEKKTIPSYQRPLVWTKAQKQSFIDNISRGFPFGSLLLYKFDDSGKYSLVDGQQRYTTLEDYRRHPEDYYPINDADSPYIRRLMSATGIDALSADAQATLRNKIVLAIKDMFRIKASKSKLSANHLIDAIEKIYPEIKGKTAVLKEVNTIQSELIDELNSYVNLTSLQIPCVIFTGDKSELPEVFANVNLGGSKLSKYQVFAAQWDSYHVKLPNEDYSDQILEKAIDHYEKLTEDRGGIEIENFNAGEMRQQRVITLPEFCHALGELIIETCPAFWPSNTSRNNDTVDTIGYNSLAIVFGIPPQELSGKPAKHKSESSKQGVPDRFRNAGFEEDPDAVETLISRIIAEYREINGRFMLHLKKPGTANPQGSGYETAKSSVQLQFLSFFAALWRLHYGHVGSSHFEPKPGYKKQGYEQALRMLFRCFTLDMLTNQWKGSGDSRLAKYINGTLEYYSDAAFTKERLRAAADAYLEDNEHVGNINADPIAKTVLTILANSQINRYTGSSYDVEHLVTQKALRTKIGNGYAYKTQSIAGGSLGNLAFLTTEENRAKGAICASDAGGELFTFDGSREFIESGSELRTANYDLLQKKSADSAKLFIRNRASIMLDKLIDIVCDE